MNDEFSTNAATGDTTGSQPAAAGSPGRRRGSRRLWRRAVAAAAVATASLAALTAGAGAAHAATLPNGPTVQLGSYPIPFTPAAGIQGGDALPAIPGTLGNPTQLFMTQSSSQSTQLLTVKGGSSTWGTPVQTAPAAPPIAGLPGLTSQIWRFQLVGYIGLKTQTSQQIATFGNPSGLLQKLPVYKIINYHADGTFTCLDASDGNPDGNPASGTMIDSWGCDPYQFNQTNQLWIIANTGQDDSMMTSAGQTYMITPGDPSTTPYYPAWLTSTLQNTPWHQPVYGDPFSVIENVAALQSSGWDTTQAPVLSASATNLPGVNSLTWLHGQSFPVTNDNSTWLIHDTTTTTAGSGGSNSGAGEHATCTGVQCLFDGDL